VTCRKIVSGSCRTFYNYFSYKHPNIICTRIFEIRMCQSDVKRPHIVPSKNQTINNSWFHTTYLSQEMSTLFLTHSTIQHSSPSTHNRITYLQPSCVGSIPMPFCPDYAKEMHKVFPCICFKVINDSLIFVSRRHFSVTLFHVYKLRFQPLCKLAASLA